MGSAINPTIPIANPDLLLQLFSPLFKEYIAPTIKKSIGAMPKDQR